MDDTHSQHAVVEIDLHGHHPDNICGEPLKNMIRQAWEMGAQGIRLIHGHQSRNGAGEGQRQ